MADTQRWDAIVISGDLSQRARDHEFAAARPLVDRFAACAPTLVVPGNHDAAWWHAPFGWGDFARVHAAYRTHIAPELEPTLRVPGVTLVGLNSAWGTNPESLTWYPRDWRVKGGLTPAQLEAARGALAAAPAGDLRLLVVHHNIVRGRLSNRWGLKQPQRVLDTLAAMPLDAVCSGHDHEERVEVVQRAAGRVVAITAGTLSSRSRGRRPSAIMVLEADAHTLTVTPHLFDASTRTFAPQAPIRVPRTVPAGGVA
jgi:3',5'-cyclic AMP phosphodiesterase CpdA